MRNRMSLLAALFLAGAFVSGCANTEKKLGRGVANTMEIVRVGELRRTVEQTCLFDSPEAGYTMGFFRGLNRSLARTGIGLYEVLTCPIPPYDPICTDFLSPVPVYPDSYTPTLVEDPLFATDVNLGFSGGDIAPFVPGSHFRVFDTH